MKFSALELPKFEVDKMNGWVKFGKDNLYPKYLLSLFDKSSTHSAIVTGKASYIYGKGLALITDSAQGQAFLKKINPLESANSLLKKVVLDHEIFYGFAVEVVPNKGKDGIACFYHMDFSKVRVSEDEMTYYYSDYWDKPSKLKGANAITKYQKFDLNNPNYKGKTIIYFKSYRPNMGTYPLPDYMGAINAIETDIRISSFHLNNIRSGFWASKVLNFNNGVPTPEEQDAIEKKVQDKFCGDENAGNFMLTFNDGTDRAMTAENLGAGDLDKQFEQLRKDTSSEIFIGHKVVSPVLFGVVTPGSLGQRNEMISAFELFQNGYINDRQELFTEFFETLAKIKGLELELEILKTEPIGAKLELATSDVIGALDRNEIRELINEEYGMELPIVAAAELVPAPVQMAGEEDDEKDTPVFLKYGSLKDNYERIHTVPCTFESDAQMRSYHAAFRRYQFKDIVTVSKSDKEILKQIDSKNPPNIEVKTLDRLREQKLVVLDEKGVPKLTDLGKLSMADIPDMDKHDISQLKVVYEYAKRPDADGPDIIPTTRPFCKAMVESNKYFSKDDIESITAEVGYDVFKKRGGWITLADGNHRPSCRHIWHQVLVKEIIK